MKQMAVFGMVLLLAAACKKGFNAKPTYASRSLARIWARQEPFYRPAAEVYIDSTATWRTFIGFSITSDAEPDKLGFANPYVAGRGTNALNMSSFYSSQLLTSDSGYYNITIPKCFHFIPDAPGSKTGKVLVIPQKVPVYRRDKSKFEIGISGEGTYSEISQRFEVEVIFDETDIGGPKERRRLYRFAP
ncbi:MAG TPA: hypothetical protein PKE63_00860 [Lacibacter sp.]|nr:hypothetical protein [Lacibacter sp.]HMO89330.1 hypothetical protein [Lacibacter sp.]HMP85793.1 hypothetical protein [Lacibacter sp.]